MIVEGVGYLHNLDPIALQVTQSFAIRWYGLAYVAGFLIGGITTYMFVALGTSPLKKELVVDLVTNTAFGTIIGGRLGYCLFYDPNLFVTFSSEAPFWGVFAMHKGGMASHGGILGLVLACVHFSWKYKLPAMHLMDLTTIGGSLGIAFGRVANFINGELVGRECPADSSLAMRFPQDVHAWPSYEPERLKTLVPVVEQIGIAQERWLEAVSSVTYSSKSFQFVHQTLDSVVAGVQAQNMALASTLAPLLTPRYPSQLIAALLEGFVVFLVVTYLFAKPRRPGMVGAGFIFSYTLMRILSESWRMPDAHLGFQLLGLTRGQWLSAALFFLGVVLLRRSLKSESEECGGWLRFFLDKSEKPNDSEVLQGS